MLMDKVTEMVAHMIGIFQTTLEEERMRDIYNKFKALLADNPELNAIEVDDTPFKAAYQLKEFTPDLRIALDQQDDVFRFFGEPNFYPTGIPLEKLPAILRPAPNHWPEHLPSHHGSFMLPTLEPPSSVVIITLQSAFLYDDDVLVMGNGETQFTDPATFLPQLQQAAFVASAIGAPVQAEMPLSEGDTTENAIALHSQITTATPDTLTSVIATVLHGQDATGLHVNGETADALPKIDEIMPAHHKPDDEPETDDTTEGDDGTSPDPFAGLDSTFDDTGPFEIEDGHAVVAGGNMLLNEVSITSAWLDAKVIAVMGDVVSLNVISQINLLVDHDSSSLGTVAGSVTINGASFLTSSTVPPPAEDDGSDPVEEGIGGLPSNWIVTKITGDLLCVNQISQYTFQTDNDIAEVAFSSTNTLIQLGDNTILNLNDIFELGYGYDLIIVGGSMISINWISQTNVLIDNDNLSYTGFSPISMSGGDNLLFNGAMINISGLDSFNPMNPAFSNAADDLAAGGNTIGADAAQYEGFAGIETLTVAYIEGDLININWIEQTNILGDSDQVQLVLDDFVATTGAEVTVTAGSNALVNLASISTFGTDSEILAGGDVYSDALIYQAELIDTDADPTGVTMPALATEAVAFLADDMMSTSDSGVTDDAIIPTPAEYVGSPDMMQTMLA